MQTLLRAVSALPNQWAAGYRIETKEISEPMAKLPRVQIINRKHPHFEEYGRFTGKVIAPIWGGGDMAEVKLESCQHGTDGCFVSKGDVRQVGER